MKLSLFKQRTRILTLMAFITCCFAGFELEAQIAMSRSTFSGTYTPITAGGGAIAATAAQTDFGIATAIPLGFSFSYLGTPYTTIALASDGWASFTATAGSATNTNIYTTTAPNATMALWWDDINSSSVLYQTTGTAGSQVFTAQWTSTSYWSTPNRTINYQLKLHEGTNVIEFHYGAVSGANTDMNLSESASIGIDNQIGGPGNYIDAVNGSSFTFNAAMNTSKWPTQNFRFTPGAPTAIAAGTYNVGAGQTYTTLSEAVADINHKGIAGAVSLNLTDAMYSDKAVGGNETYPVVFGPVVGTSSTNTVTITGNAADLRYSGSISGNWANGSATGTMFFNTAEPALGLCGMDYLSVNNLKITGLNGVAFGTNLGNPGRLDRGIAVQNCGAVNGATNNNFTDITVTLDRTHTGSMAIDQGTATIPTSALGANSGNKYKNLTIKNSHKGISLGGNATWPDVGSEIGTTACSIYNMIGDPTVANDLGLSTSTIAAYGIVVTNQSGIKIYNNIVRNITTSGGQTDGISILTFQGVSEVYNNKVQTLKNTGTASLALLSGIRASHTTTGTHTLRIYNNSISEITGSYTGAASATRALRGIYIVGTGGATTQLYEISNNSVSIDGSATPNVSSTCYEIATTSGPVFSLKNNVFANFTGAQTGIANHMCLFSPAAAIFGNTGTTSNYNDLYVANATNGFTGVGNTTTYPTLANWQAAMVGLEVNAVATDPLFGSNTADLHSAAAGLNNTGTTAFAYVTTDYDCAARTDNDMGAYNVNSCSTVVGGTISPTSVTRCAAQTYTMTAVGATLPSIGLTYQWEVSATGGGAGFASVTGGSGANTASYTTGALVAGTYYYRLNVTCSAGPTTVYSNELTLSVNPQPSVVATPATGLYCNPGTAVSITASGADTYSWTPATGLSATTGAMVAASPSATTTYTVTGTLTATGCTNTATSAITSAPAVTMDGVTATPTAVCSGANSVLSASASTGGTVNLYGFVAGTGTTLDPMTGATTLSASGNDDTVTPTATAIGFSFTFNTIAYTHFHVSPDGWLSLGGAGYTGTNDFSNQVTDLTNVPKLYPYWDDMATGTTGYVRYVVNGTAPNRILVVEWFTTIPRATGGAANSTFQAWLYETTNLVEFRYGTMGAAAMSASVGLTGSTPVSQFNCVTIATNTNSTSVTNDANGGQPTSGTVYTFNPPVVSSYSWTANTTPTFLVTDNTATVNANAITANRVYTVTATNSFGCTATGTASVTSGSALNTPVMSNSPACTGAAYTVTATVTGGGAPYSYSWVDANFTVYPSAATISIPASAAGAYLYEVHVTDNCGASVMNTITVNVSNSPVAATTPDTTAACGGVAASLAASAMTNGTPGTYTYTWYPTTGLSASTGASVTANPSMPTAYNVIAVETSTGCKDTATAQVNVGVGVVVTSATATPATICAGSNTDLSATAAGAGGGVVKITEVITFRTGTGAGTYPAFIAAAADDMIEISNISSSPVDISGWSLADYASNSATATHAGFVFPAGTILPGNSVAVIHMGTGTDDVANRYFNMGGTSGFWGSTSIYGILLKNGATTIDAVGRGAPYIWAPALNVTAGDWSGNIVTTSAAGIRRTVAADNNVGTDWTLSSAGNLTTMGTYDAIFFDPVGTISYAWSPSTYLATTTGSPVTATAVAATTTYTVTATSSIGCSGTGTATVTINPLSCTGITAAATRCGGQNFALVVGHTGGGSPYTYTWSDGVGGTYVSNDTITANLAPGTYTFSVTVNDNCGSTCTSNLPGVVVNYSPVASVTPPAGAICSGVPASISLAASATTNGSAGTYTYTWAPTAGLTPSNAATVSAAPAASTIYTVLVTEPSTGCAGTATATIGVGTTVTMNSVTANPAAVCPGGTSVLTASASTASGTYCTANATATGITDNIANVTFAGINNNSPGWPGAATGNPAAVNGYGNYIAVTPAAITAGSTYPISVISYHDGSYYGTFSTAHFDWNKDGDFADAGESYSIGASVAAGTAVNANISVPPTATNGNTRMRIVMFEGGSAANPFCGTFTYGEVEDYTVTVSGGFDPMSYSWTPGAGLAATTGASVTTNGIATPPATFNVTAVSAAGCTATGAVTVNASTPIACTNITVPSVKCHNNNFILVANTTGGGGAFTYSWVDGAGGTYTSNDTITVNKAAGTYTFTVYITDACGSSCNMNTSVTIDALPTVAIAPTPSNALICATGSVALAASGADTYSWTPGTSLSATNVASVTATPTSTTNYTVLGINVTTGCANSASQTVTFSKAVAMGAVSATPSTTCAGSNAVLSTSASEVVASYCTANATGTTFTDNIANLTFGGINNNSANYPAGGALNNANANQLYTDYTAVTPAPVTAGSTYPIEVTQYQTNGYYGTFTTAHFDWNQDGDFADAGETYSVGNTASAGVAVVATVAVPANAINGNTRMRVVMVEGGSASNPYCGTFSYGEVEDYTVTVSGGTPASVISYAWDNSAGTGASVTVAPTATTTYTVIASNTAGCADTGTVAVTVNPLPTASISGTTSVCQNGTAPNVTFTGATGTAPYTFTYKINGGADQTVTTTSGNSVTVSVATVTTGAYAYTLVSVADANTCTQAQTGTATVTVNTLPTATIAGTTTVCQNSTAPNVTFTGATGTAPYTFTYKINGGADQMVTTTSGSSVTVSAATTTNGAFVYTLVSVSDSNMCSQAQTDTATVTVDEAVTATAGANQAACNTATVTMSPTTPTVGTGAWTGGAGMWAGNVYTPSASESASGASITASWTVTNGTCSAISTATITVDAPAVAVAGSDVSTCAATLVTLSPTTPTVGTGVWTGGLGTWAGNNYTPTAGESNSSITVTWTVTNGTCSATDMAVVVVDTTAPTITFTPGAQTMSLDSLCNGVLADYTTMATANDNCSGYVVTQSPGIGSAVYGSGTTTVILTVTDAANRTATTSFGVTRNLFSPTIVAGGATTFCTGGSVTLQASSNGAYSYQWYKDAVLISGANVSSLLADASGSYHVAISVTGGCTLTSNAIVVDELAVPAAPTISTTPAAVSGVVNICSNGSVTLTGSSAAEYLWYKNGVAVNYSLSPTYMVSSPGTNVYTLVVVPTGSSCISSQASPITVVRSSLSSTISLSGPTSFCATSPTTLSANPVGASYSYVWEKSTIPVGTLSTYTPTVSGNYSLVVTDSLGCTASSGKVSINILATPAANAGLDKSVCSNLSTVIGSTATTSYSYSWSPSTGLSSTTVSKPTVSPTTTSTTTYVVTVTNTTTGCSKTDSVNVTGLAIPSTATLSGTASPVCQGSSVVLTPSVSGGTLAVWYKNGVGLYTKPSTTNATFNVVTSTADSYTIKGRNVAGCLSTNFSNAVSVMIKEAPTPTITSNPAAVGTLVTICNLGGTTGTATLTSNSTALATPTYSWQQLVGTTYNNIAAGNSYVASVSTTPSTSNNKIFRVQATYPNGCVKTSSTTKVRILASGCTPRDGDVKGNSDLTEIVMESDLLTAYPNPTDGILNVGIENCAASEGKLVLYNALGQIVTEVNMTLINGKAVETLDLRNVAAGVYTLSFQTETSQKVQKVVKE